MKPLRLLALVIAATAWCTSAAFACDGAKTSASNASACGTKSATAAHASCAAKGTTAVTAAHEGCAAKSATTATAASAVPDCCAKGRTTATAASAGPKAAGSASGCTMSAAECKAMEASGACNAQMKAACAAKGTRTASAGSCSMHATAAHANCVVCSDELECDDDVRATGARAQIVALRNGAMIVYTLEGSENVRALQAAVARHNQGVVAALQGDAKLCGECKKLRGALASGKLTREVINVERGCQLLIMSSDRSIVQQVQACANAQVAARTSTKL